MAKFFINEDCFNCFACVDICPAEAIRVENGTHIIDPGLCSECKACIDVCPVDAIKFE